MCLGNVTGIYASKKLDTDPNVLLSIELKMGTPKKQEKIATSVAGSKRIPSNILLCFPLLSHKCSAVVKYLQSLSSNLQHNVIKFTWNGSQRKLQLGCLKTDLCFFSSKT